MHFTTLQPSLYEHYPLSCYKNHPCFRKGGDKPIPWPRAHREEDDDDEQTSGKAQVQPCPMGNSCTTSPKRDFETTTHKWTVWWNQRSPICSPPQNTPQALWWPPFCAPSILDEHQRTGKTQTEPKQFNPVPSAAAISGKSSNFIILLNTKLCRIENNFSSICQEIPLTAKPKGGKYFYTNWKTGIWNLVQSRRDSPPAPRSLIIRNF